MRVGYRSSAELRPEAGDAERLGVGDEVRVAELDPERPPELVALLPVDEAVAVVAPDDDGDVRPDPLRGLELLGVHQEAAVAAQRDDLAARGGRAWRRSRPGSEMPIAANPFEMITVFGS